MNNLELYELGKNSSVWEVGGGGVGQGVWTSLTLYSWFPALLLWLRLFKCAFSIENIMQCCKNNSYFSWFPPPWESCFPRSLLPFSPLWNLRLRAVSHSSQGQSSGRARERARKSPRGHMTSFLAVARRVSSRWFSRVLSHSTIVLIVVTEYSKRPKTRGVHYVFVPVESFAIQVKHFRRKIPRRIITLSPHHLDN